MSKTGVNKKSSSPKVLTIYYSHSGNTRKIAREIHQTVGGDILEIQPLEPYPNNYNTLVEQARRELDSGYKPKLRTSAENIASYDTIFVGSPNWCHRVAPPVITFLSEADLSGKTIIPFITHGGGGVGRSAEDIAGLCPNATVLKGPAVYGTDLNAAQKWLSVHWPV